MRVEHTVSAGFVVTFQAVSESHHLWVIHLFEALGSVFTVVFTASCL